MVGASEGNELSPLPALAAVFSSRFLLVPSYLNGPFRVSIHRVACSPAVEP